jgi:hypothetical protein
MSDVKACKQVGCPVRENGQCLEGIDLDKDTCTHFYWDEDGETGSDEEEPAIPPAPGGRTTLFSGNELTLSEITLVTQKYSADLIVILGDLDCGKTTLLATIYDLLQVGDFKDYSFAGSLTQKGFEIRSHLARVSSGSAEADTERTKTLEFRILHLAIKSKKQSRIKHLLLSDVSGETIRQARSSAKIMKEQLSIAKQADHLFYIIDGEQLLIANRVKTMLNTDLFFQSAINNGIFDNSTVLNVVISKWDKLKGQRDFDLEKIVIQKIDGRFGQHIGQINYSMIAARPGEENEEFDLGYGVGDFLDNFFKIPEKVYPVIFVKEASGGQFDKFKMQDYE